MQITYYKPGATTAETAEPKGDRVRIGRAADNDIVLNSPFVAPEAAVLELKNGGWEITVLQFGNVRVGDKKLSFGEKARLEATQTINIFPVDLIVKSAQVSGPGEGHALGRLGAELSDLIADIHQQLREKPESRLCIDRILMKLEKRDGDRGAAEQVTDDDLLSLEGVIDEFARMQGLKRLTRKELVDHVAGLCVQGEVLRSLAEPKVAGLPNAWYATQDWSRMASQVPARESELRSLVKQTLDATKASEATDLSVQMDLVHMKFWDEWSRRTGSMIPETIDYLAARHVKKEMKDLLYGLGPLEDLLKIPAITEIMVVDRDHIYIERNNRLEKSGRRFVSDDVTVNIINRIVRKVGRSINTSEPLVDARMPDGSRVNAVIAPLAVSGPCITIRRFPEKRLRMENLVAVGAINATAADFLRAAVACKKNIIISGGTGSGKTTMLNCLADSIPERERIITIEDTAELQIPREHRVRLEARKANVEKQGAFTIGDLVRNALRMRPDRIVVGECRGAEAMDMLQAMNTGHAGSMTTIHANSAGDVVRRLEVLVQMAELKLPVSSIYRQIVSAVDVIVQLSRLRDGRRRVVQISEVTGLDETTGEPTLRDLFMLEEDSADPQLLATGHLPTFMSELIDRGVLNLESFYLPSAKETTS